MRIAILSDVHANRLALQAVLEDTLDSGLRVERYWFLGDAVGYGPAPALPLLWLKEMLAPDDWVIGNHDAMLADLLLPDDLAELSHIERRVAFKICERTGEGQSTGKVLYHGLARSPGILRPDQWESLSGVAPIRAIELNRAALAEDREANAFWRAEARPGNRLLQTHTLDGVDYVLTHARQGDLGHYLYAWQTDISLPAEFGLLREQAWGSGRPRVQCYGHTHVPTLVRARSVNDGNFDMETVCIFPGERYSLDVDLALVNPGSVGQPRDGDRRAAYAIIDTERREVTFRRVPYDWQAVALEMQAKGYPESLWVRLRDAEPTSETPQAWREFYEIARSSGD